MRARNVAFPNDAVALSASRTELKTQFLANASEKDKASVQEMLAGIDEVEDMLRGGIAQGVLTEEGNYNVKGKFIPPPTRNFYLPTISLMKTSQNSETGNGKCG